MLSTPHFIGGETQVIGTIGFIISYQAYQTPYVTVIH